MLCNEIMLFFEIIIIDYYAKDKYNNRKRIKGGMSIEKQTYGNVLLSKRRKIYWCSRARF